ncbi:cytochrome d ubiquinol oxidase subunit II [Halalkalibacter krulwichiae]|uniref:Putative cytochrome bd menaquinol oxidase subunit II n=1 Tax=Halalkalibacter krulwichiae TaxID=199441 RepID=A0A1X9M8C1_9BACI|nr:cytochrome d ubiquinol oxidase subunit II [Halalkalibacter krulwichiae]ARK28924.1 Putative cytochrome bd menaquinol oxidase subunit II [Halalkalibacter krulwichiae]
MTIEIIGISVLWLFLFGYVIVASIDFGAGFFNASTIVTKKNHIVNTVIQRYLSPVWEITNVFLVFFFVGMIGFFPKTAYYFGTVLLIPISISIILLALRGSYYAFGTYGTKGHKGYTIMYGVTGVLIPASLSTALIVSQGGFIRETATGGIELDYAALFTSPFAWSIVLLSLVSVLFISASFLAYYSSVAKDQGALTLFRRYTWIWSFPTIITALGIMIELRWHNPDHYQGMLSLWWLFVLSFVCFVWSLWLLKKRSYGWSFIFVVLQFALAFYAYGVSRYPYLLYPNLTIYDSFTNETMAYALITAFIFGFMLLIPSLYLVFKLFIMNKPYIQKG